MKIACVDKTANDRVQLQRYVDQTYEQCRSAVGHLSLFHVFPASREEILFSTPPDAAVIGPALPFEESFLTCRELHQRFPLLPIFVFLAPENFSLRALRRFEGICCEVLTQQDAPVRFLHRLLAAGQKSENRGGKLIVVQGVKGGVGTTSIVSGLAHAAQALNKQAIVLDLSRESSFAHYMGADRWQSSDYASLIVDQITPDRQLLEKLITSAPNGVDLLLPPAGGTEVREMWIRDGKRFETTLCIIEMLRERYDLVLVDSAHAEGILHYAIMSRADARLFVTSNDPASVHLLSHCLANMAEIPGNAVSRVLINLLVERGLKKKDILGFFASHDRLPEGFTDLEPLGFDQTAKNWIGTGNTFYTEASKATQLQLERIVRELIEEHGASVASRLRSALRPSIQLSSTQTEIASAKLGLSVEGSPLRPATESLRARLTPRLRLPLAKTRATISPRTALLESPVVPSQTTTDSNAAAHPLYQSPSLSSEQGSMSLENILYLAATMLVASTGIVALITMLSGYYCNFQDGDRFQNGVVVNSNIEVCQSSRR